MAHEKAIREARKALDMGYSEKDSVKLLRARGLDKDEIKKELVNLKALKIVNDAKKAAAEKNASKEKTQDTNTAYEKKSSVLLWLIIIVIIGIISYLIYAGVISTDIFNIISFK